MEPRVLLEDTYKIVQQIKERVSNIEASIDSIEGGMEELLKATREAQELLNSSPAIKFQKAMMRRGKS